MRIAVKLAFDDMAALRLLNWLALENELIHRLQPSLPLLYESGVVYERERDETWCDYLHLLMQGHEDCDGLAAARAGELRARGWRALAPGEAGYEEARRLKLEHIAAEPFLRTRSAEDQPGLYHCLVHYPVNGIWYRDDPSARLGMYGYLPEATLKRWTAAGIKRHGSST